MTCSMLSAIIAAVAARKKTRKSVFANEVNARCLDGGGRGAVVSEFNAADASIYVYLRADCSGNRRKLFGCRPVFGRIPQISTPTNALVSRIRGSPMAVT